MRLKRLVGVFLLINSLFAVIVLRLWSITVGRGDMLTEAALRQQHVTVPLAERTGFIYDRNGQLLNYIEGYGAALVEPLLNLDQKTAVDTLVLYGDLKSEEAEELMEGSATFGVELSRSNILLSGFTVVEAVKEQTAPPAIHMLSGIEGAYADYLADTGGHIYASLQRTASGIMLPGGESRLIEEDYYKAGGVMLTIDAEIQAIVEDAFTEDFGAVVLTEISSGKIISSASFPSYDKEDIPSLLNSEDGELYNRALSPYNVGSIFKIIVAAQALERDIEIPIAYCDGSVTVAGREFACHLETGHGWVSLEEGFEQSCNSYFITLLDEMGHEATLEMAHALGLDSSTVFAEGFSEGAGMLPSHDPTPLVMANSAIGQGDIMATPLDLASIVATVARGGLYIEPTLVEGLVDREGNMLQNLGVGSEGSYVWSQETSDSLLYLLAEVTSEGTGKGAQPDSFEAGGKTASAETGWITEHGEQVVHGIFAGLFPADSPKYSLVVLVENGRSGSASAAPIFKEIAENIAKFEGGY